MKTLLALLLASSANAAVQINGSQINPASSITISSITVIGSGGVDARVSSVTAASFFGDGSHLTGVTGGGACVTGAGLNSVLCSGSGNSASDSYSTVSGGFGNLSTGNSSTVGGGDSNSAGADDYAATVGGGDENIASDYESTVSGGGSNTASGSDSVVGGGAENEASGFYSAIFSGNSNIASGDHSAIAGGKDNRALGDQSFIAGGEANAATGAQSFAGGEKSSATADNSFVWSDGNSGQAYQDHGANTFNAHSSGGFFFDGSSVTASSFWGDGSHLTGTVPVSISSYTADLSSIASFTSDALFTKCIATVTVTLDGINPVIVSYAGGIYENGSGGVAAWNFLMDSAFVDGLTGTKGVMAQNSYTTSGLDQNGSAEYQIPVSVATAGSHTFCVQLWGGAGNTVQAGCHVSSICQAKFGVRQLH